MKTPLMYEEMEAANAAMAYRQRVAEADRARSIRSALTMPRRGKRPRWVPWRKQNGTGLLHRGQLAAHVLPAPRSQ